MSIRFLTSLALLGWLVFCAQIAHAEGRCPPGYFPVGDIRTSYGCAPIPGYESNVPQPSAPQDTGPSTLQRPPQSSQATWGAIGYSTENGTAGLALNNYLTKDAAEDAALKRCADLGGTNCVVAMAFYDQCGAAARSSLIFSTAGGVDVAQATDRVIARCQKATEKAGLSESCVVTWTGCTDYVRVSY